MLPLQNVLAHVALPQGEASQTHGEKDFAKTASNLLAGRTQMTRNRAGTYIKYLVDGLAGNMRSAAASDEGHAIECCARRRRF
jgi:hypothetical protein